MTEPVIADRKPRRVTLSAGETYAWCACGRSANQPFCDGSHAGTDFRPLAFEVEQDGDAQLCLCKRSGNKPYCDGSHARLPETAGDAQSGGGAQPARGAATPEEPTLEQVHELARSGLEKLGHHGEMVAMGVPRPTLPQWSDLQMLMAQFATKPLLDGVPVGSEMVIGPNAKKPLRLEIPLFVSDMSFGALSEEAKIALARGAELVGTGICSG